MVQVAPYYRLSGRPPAPLLRGTVVAYLAGDPFYYRIQPDKRKGQQGPDVHAENPLRDRIFPPTRHDGMVQVAPYYGLSG